MGVDESVEVSVAKEMDGLVGKEEAEERGHEQTGVRIARNNNPQSFQRRLYLLHRMLPEAAPLDNIARPLPFTLRGLVLLPLVRLLLPLPRSPKGVPPPPRARLPGNLRDGEGAIVRNHFLAPSSSFLRPQRG
eukprot:TRINITY_DN22940_c0_g1_i1.p2 TRINITY_DN22940_c0_g1~~TRINITY_DN22940_c0_g1_i1.p2  ORF type:complete len:133 (+),score=21.70 TRINITY_DN22940_c0_g1_i1:1305-1703(+)